MFWVSPAVGITTFGGLTFPFVHRTFIVNARPAFEVRWITGDLSLGVKLRAW